MTCDFLSMNFIVRSVKICLYEREFDLKTLSLSTALRKNSGWRKTSDRRIIE